VAEKHLGVRGRVPGFLNVNINVKVNFASGGPFLGEGVWSVGLGF